jgi:hypothetical protein
MISVVHDHCAHTQGMVRLDKSPSEPENDMYVFDVGMVLVSGDVTIRFYSFSDDVDIKAAHEVNRLLRTQQFLVCKCASQTCCSPLCQPREAIGGGYQIADMSLRFRRYEIPHPCPLFLARPDEPFFAELPCQAGRGSPVMHVHGHARQAAVFRFISYGLPRTWCD